ncbi:MAG: hypothetical protein Q8P05_03970 [Candidatus Diapherotrites archaeon]|nr:hypothetical protein [Candidatus Diapherotrites archaeon]
MQVLHYPTLKTVLLVEEILKEAKEPLSRYELLKRAGNKIMRPTLDVIIEYFEKRFMVLDTPKGIIWVYTPKDRMKKLIQESVEV